MAAPMIVLGFMCYGLAGLVFAGAPTITQETFAGIVAINGTLFVVGGAIITAINSAPKA